MLRRHAQPAAAIRLGDPVRVAVRQVDAPRGRVDLDLVGIPES